jgi:hypothetical protein
MCFGRVFFVFGIFLFFIFLKKNYVLMSVLYFELFINVFVIRTKIIKNKTGNKNKNKYSRL